MNKKFVNRQNVYRFYRPTYEPQKSKENKQKNAKMRFYLFWQGHLCNSRTDFIRDLLSFGKDVKFFLESKIKNA